jgi:putative ABC transport system ATP-binding protein
MGNIIEATGLTKIYENNGPDTPAIKNITLSIRKGESVAIIGKSGSGKSTLMHILATLDRPTDGELVIDGNHAHTLSASELDQLRNSKFGFVFQQFFVNARNSCLENVTLPLIIKGVPPGERNRRGQEMLELVGLGDKANSKAGELSGGQKQRLCIARALIVKPELIFADEPTGNLDTENGKHIVNMLFRLQREEGITIVVVTHDPDLAALCDRSIIIKDGQIVNIKEKST